MNKPNKAAFKRVCDELEAGAEFNFNMVGDVFGTIFWQLLVLSLMDANDAARAIQGAINRLRMQEDPTDEDDSDNDLDVEDDKEPS